MHWSGYGDSKSRGSTSSPPAGWQLGPLCGEGQHEVWKLLAFFQWKHWEAVQSPSMLQNPTKIPFKNTLLLFLTLGLLLRLNKYCTFTPWAPKASRHWHFSQDGKLLSYYPMLLTPCFLGAVGSEWEVSEIKVVSGLTDRFLRTYKKVYVKIFERRCHVYPLPSIC